MNTQQPRGLSYIIVGPAGCGKSRWIRQQSQAAGHQLFRWNCRDDRALRQGRELLHGIVRTQEPTWVWLEGADDVTLDAQAFLRRILETASAHVTCVLEVRKLECMSEPIQSRCILKRISAHSYRQQNIKRTLRWEDDMSVPVLETLPSTLQGLQEARLAGVDPNWLLQQLAKESAIGNEALKRFAQGASPWILSAWILSSANRNSQ
jgi:DNA polymerase III delta prime subunit